MASQSQPAHMPDYTSQEDDPVAGSQTERRLHIRAYNYWESLLGDRTMPSLADLTRDGLEPFAEKSFLIDFENGYASPLLKHVGAAIEAQSQGLGLSGSALMDVPRKTLLGRLADHYMEVLANRAPIGFEAEYMASDTDEILYRGILLPLSDDDENIHLILGVINWKVERRNLSLAATTDPFDDSDDADDVVDTPSDDDVAGAVARLRESLRKNNLADLQVDDDEPVDTGDLPLEAEGLHALLAQARKSASAVQTVDSRGRAALYSALSSAMKFYAAAAVAPDDYRALLEDSGIREQSRAPFTPVVKLVFGKDYEKSRLNEYSLTLAHASRNHVSPEGLPAFLQQFDGGIKGCVKAERTIRREESASNRPDVLSEKKAALRDVPTLDGPVDAIVAPGEDDYVLVLARRVDCDTVAAIRVLDEKASTVDTIIKRIRTD